MSSKATGPSSDGVVHGWDALRPATAPGADHAYSRLTETELRQLACLARARWLVATGRDGPDRASLQEAARIERAFAERGWNADWLLAQRQIVRQHRIQYSYNAEVDGRRAELVGLVLPLDWGRSGEFTRFLLTPEVGECSHEPPPPHHQVVYIESPAPLDVGTIDASDGGELRLSVVGSIRFAASSHRAFLVDGLLRVDASYVIEPDGIDVTCDGG